MSWLFSQALVEASSAGISLDGAPCALWNGTPTQPASWLPAKTTKACRLSQSGMTFKPLTDEHGQAVLTWCLEDSHARTSAAPEREQESTETEAACGSTWLGLSVRFDLASSSWKTAQCLFPEDCHESSVTLPRWGMMRNGECWERTTSALPTSGTGSGLWRTPSAHEPGVSAERLVPIEGGTPGGMNRHFDKHTGRMTQIGLIQQVRLREMWPTPSASHCETRPPATFNPKSQSGRSLGAMARHNMWPTRTAQDSKNNGAPSQMDRNTKPLNAEVGGKLNPPWVEWLMGWPIGWTGLEPLETGRFQAWQHSLGQS